MQLILYLLINGAAIFLAAQILPGIHVDSFFTSIIVAIIFGLLNTFLKPILTLLTLPLTIFTFGLFLLVINVLIVFLTAKLVDGFGVDGWIWALLFSLFVTVISSFLNGLSRK